MPHIILDVSAHGFGHLSQVTPVIWALRAKLTDLRFTVRCDLAPAVVHRFLGDDFDLIKGAPAAVLAMDGPDRVDVLASLAAYRNLHADWDGLIDRECATLQALQADLLISDVDYSGLAAAARLGLPSMAMSSLNWADIARAYLADEAGFAPILATMQEAYQGAEVFFRFEPALPMEAFKNTRAVGPVARLGRSDAQGLHQSLALDPEKHLGLVSFGGIERSGDQPDLIADDAIHWIVGGDLRIDRPDVTIASDLDLDFIDLLASVDFVVTKPGYGTFAEAACNGIAVFYTTRPDWPEYPHLIDWLHRNTRGCAIALSDLGRADFAGRVTELLSKAKPAPPKPTGADDVAHFMAARLLGL